MPKKINPQDDVLDFVDPFEVFEIGPMNPFDYCWLTGMKKGLILEVQMELIHRNPNLVVVDRSPLGVDPNAPLTRCYLAFGNPYDRVTVFNFYENDICRGVPLDYFSRIAVTRRIDQVYKENGWATGTYLTKSAEDWRVQYHKAIAALAKKMMETEDKVELSETLDKYALWLIPLVHYFTKPDVYQKYSEYAFSQIKSFWRDLLSDYMVLSTTRRTTFCVLSSIEEIYFKDTYLGKAEMIEQNAELFVFKPFLLKTSGVLLIVALIIWNVFSNNSNTGLTASGIFVSFLVTLIPVGILLTNFVFWIFFTSGSDKLKQRVPKNWISPLKKIPGYLK